VGAARRQGQHPARERAGSGAVEVVDLTGIGLSWARRHGVRTGDVVVLRPDRVVFAVGAASRIPPATAWLDSELGLRARVPVPQH
jgi:hypothetical protein